MAAYHVSSHRGPDVVLKEIVRRSGLSRESTAEALGVSPETLYNWCIGVSTMRLPHLAKCVSLLMSSGMPSGEVQTLLVDLLTEHGLSPQQASELFPPKRSASQQTVLYLVSELTRPACIRIVGARDWLKQMGVGLFVVVAVPGDSGLANSLTDFLMSVNLRGILLDLTDNIQWALDLIRPLSRCNVPIVEIYRRHNVSQVLDWPVARFIGFDNFGIGLDAGSMLVRMGHKRLGFLGTRPSHGTAPERFRGFGNAIAAAGCVLDSASVFWAHADFGNNPDLSLTNDTRVVLEIAALVDRLRDGNISGVFCANEDLTGALARAMEVRHDELSRTDFHVVGISVTPQPVLTKHPRFLNVSLPAFELGRQAARILMLEQTANEVLIPYDVHPMSKQPLSEHATLGSCA